MLVTEVIKQRRSIRSFKPEPVPDELMSEIMQLALRAPSGSNVQPWECIIVRGPKLEEIKQAYVEMIKQKQPPRFDFPLPMEYPEPYDSRRKDIVRSVVEDVLGIKREEKEKRAQFWLRGTKLWGAGTAIYICLDASLVKQDSNIIIWPIFDCGLLAENIMLLATSNGLGTAALAQAVAYPDILRKILEIPDSKLFVIGIAFGYPDWNDPINEFRSERVPMSEAVKWY
jgi:nitroreductase